MPTREKRVQIRTRGIEPLINDLAKLWSRTEEPLTPSEVMRECVRRVHRAEFEEPRKVE